MENKASKFSSDLSIEYVDGKTKILLDGIMLKNVLDYKIMSPAKGTAELTVTMIVNFPIAQK